MRRSGVLEQMSARRTVEGTSRRILFLAVNFEGWVASTLYDEQQAIARLLPESEFCGPGYRYETADVGALLRESCGGAGPEAVFCYLDERRLLGEPLAEAICARYGLPESLRVFPRGLKDVRLPKIAWINDFWHCSAEEWEEILLGHGFTLAFATYCPPFVSEELFGQFFSHRVRQAVRFVPWPRSANPAIFRDYGLAKEYDVSLLGAMDPDFYPLRNAMHRAFAVSPGLRYLHRPHPGYAFHPPGSALVGETYARLLNQSRIFASCTGKYRLPFIKLYEVLGCGSLLVADAATGGEYLGLRDGENCAWVSAGDFLSRVRDLLGAPEELARLAANGAQLFRTRHTAEVRAHEFVRTLDALLDGREPGGWADLAPPARRSPATHTRSTSEPAEATWEERHILEVVRPADGVTLCTWLRYGCNQRPHEDPPVVTQFPELVVLRGVYLRQLAEEVGAQHLAEVGTARGFQAAMWAQYLEDVQSPAGCVYTCDVDGMDARIYKTPLSGDVCLTRQELWADDPRRGRVRFVHGPSRLLAQQIAEPLDVLFIDGSHDESAVLQDWEALQGRLHAGSVVVFDDCDDRFPGVQRAVATIANALGVAPRLVSFSPSPYQIAVLQVPAGLPRPAPQGEQREVASIPSQALVLAPRIVGRDGDWALVGVGDIVYRLNPARYLDRELVGGALFEAPSVGLLRSHARPGMTVVDVGANFGYYTLLFSRWVGSAGHVIAFEPTKEYGDRLRAHLEANGADNVRVERIGLSDRDGDAAILVGECSATLHWTFDLVPRATERIRLQRFDDWWAEYVAAGHPDRLDLLKVDLDGHEPCFLRGAVQTLKRLRPILHIEFFSPQYAHAGASCAEMAEWLETEIGYSLCKVTDGTPYASREERDAAISDPTHSINVLCLPTPQRKPDHTGRRVEEPAGRVPAERERREAGLGEAKGTPGDHPGGPAAPAVFKTASCSLPRVLVIVDTPNWAHDRKTENLARVCAPDFELVKRYEKAVTPVEIAAADLVQVYYWMQIERVPALLARLDALRGRLLVGICSAIEFAGDRREPGLAWIRRYAAGVFANNLMLHREFAFALEVPVFYTPNGVDTQFFTPGERLGENSGLRVGWAGSLTNHGSKRGYHEYIVPAVGEVPGAALVTAAREERWRDAAEMREFYRSLDVYVCASWEEGTPNPNLEAAACGVPLLTTPVGNMPELLRDGVNGYFIRRDAADIAEKLALLRDNPALRAYLGQNLRRAVEAWDWRAQADNYRFMYRTMLS